MAQQYSSTDTEQNLSTGKGMVKRQHTKKFQQLDNPGRMQDHNGTSVGTLTESLGVEMSDGGIELASNRLDEAVDNSLLNDLALSTEAHPLRGSQLSSMYSGEWLTENELINNGPISLNGRSHSVNSTNHNSSICYNSSDFAPVNLSSSASIQPLGTKVEMVYSLLSMLDTHGKDQMSLKLLEMSKSPECCVAMRQSGCLPLLVQLLHGNQRDSTDDDSNTSREAFRESRQYASQALHNIVHAHPDDKRGRREARVLRMLEQIRDYCDAMRDLEDEKMQSDENANKVDDHPGPAIAALMKLSFDEEHRHAICQLGGLQAIAELIKVDHDVHGNTRDGFCMTLRRYAGMALTNLTFGDGTNKALLCSMKPFMHSLVSQLHSPNEDLRQVTASVLRNLSWRADSASKKALRSVGVVTTLTKSAMEATKESTLKSILSALWNLSAHCSNNKADICAVDGALAFLVSTLMYKSLSKTLSVVENGGGILRNISSHVALCEEYRVVLRKHNCLQILLEHLKSPSLTIVSNACGTLWNLSARCIQDQRILWELGAVNMLRRLIHSRHKMIAMGSSAALKNLVTAKIPGGTTYSLSSMYESGHFGTNMPSLHVRKQRALEAEIDHNLSETYDNIDSPKNSPTHNVNLENRFMFQGISQPRYAASLPSRIYDNGNGQIRSQEVSRSDSHDSLGSSHSEPLYPHLQSGAFRLISRNAKFVSPDHRHYSVKIAEWKDFQFSPLKDNCVPFGKCPMLLNPSVSYSFNDCSAGHTEVSKNGNEGNNLSNVFEFSKPEKQVNLNNEEKNSESKESNNYETEISDEDSDKIETSNLTTSTIGDSTAIKSTSHLSKLATIAQKIDLFNIEDQDAHEQPIDYSLKYREENMALLPDTCNQHDHNKHPPPKIDNYLQDTAMTSRPLYKESALSTTQCVSHWNNTQVPHVTTDEKSTADCIRDAYSTTSFQESDTDNPDQPTDFSQKYAEHIDPMDLHQKEEDKLFEHCSEGTRFNSPESKHPYISDDTIKVYCTEDTPLNFSSASSLTDLRDIHMSTPSETYSSLKEGKDIRKHEIESSSQSQQVSSCNLKDSVDVSLREAVSEKKEIEKSNLSPKKALCNPEKEGKTVTFGEEVNYAEETPLMFSRCSSLGSLSSFEQHSIHDDHSSVISDFSRRASEVVSPSDLPDSPSQTLPPSPQRDKQSVFNFKEKAPNNDSEDVSSPNLVSKIKNASMFEDCRISFAEEGMPPEFSRATSLSSLTIDDELKIPKELKLKDGRLTIEGDKFQIHEDRDKDDKLESPLQSGQTTSEKDSGPSSNEPSPSDEIEEKSDMSEAESAEDDILAACINSGIPNNNGYCNELNNTKLRSKVNNLSSMSVQLKVSNIPTKTSNIRFTPPMSNISRSLAYANSAAGSNTSHRENFGEDSLKVYKTEDTPSSLSHATSLSDLSNVSCTDSNRSNEAAKSNRDNHSDSSSVCDENDNLLLKCIQSGLPQPRKRQVPREADRCGDGASSPDNVPFKSKLPFMNLRKTSDPLPLKINVHNSQYKPQNICHNKNNVECKATKIYCTPSHSWQNANRDKRFAQIRGHQRSHSIGVSAQSCSNHGTNGTYSHGLSESPKTYETEGTPVNFSCNDSLSSLSCEDDSDLREQRKINFGYIERTANKVSKSPAVSLASDIPNSHSLAIPSNTSLSSERYNENYPFSQKTVCKNHFENSGTTKQSYSLVSSSRENRQEIFQEQDSIHASQIEGTPVCFSRNSSLSSLSMDSTDEPSSSEQALLEECISFGMPKDKSVKNKHSRSKSKLSCPESKLPIRDYDQSYKNNKQKKTNDNIKRVSVTKCLSFPLDNEVSEEKGMEDERTKEKQKFVSFDSLDDGLVSAIQKSDETRSIVMVEKSHQGEIDNDVNINEKYEETDHNLQQNSYTKDVAEDKSEEKNESINDDSGLSVSTVIKLEAERIGEAIEELADDMTQSSVSCISDIENVNPPSAMDLNISACSNGVAEWFPNKLDSNSKSRALGKKIFKNTRKQIPEPVRRALAGNLDIMKISTGSDILCNLKPPSAMGSIENLSMKSSCTSELLENVNPPSLMDDISMIASTASLNSISAGTIENHAVEVNCANDMYEKLNAAATMVQVYSREYAAITNGSTKSSKSSDMIEHVKPPSMTHNITEFTIEDATELASDTMESDTEIGEDLPCDDDTGSETLKATNISPLTKDEPYEGSTENLVSSFTDTDTLEYERNDCNTNHMETDHPLEGMNITAEEMLVLQENAQLVVTTLNEIQMTGSSDSDPDAVNSNEMIEDETLSLVSNESDDDLPINEESNSEKTMSEVSNDCTLQDDDITQNSTVNDINTNTFTKKSAVDSSTFTRMKVPKTKVATANGSSNSARMTFQSQNNDDSTAACNVSSDRLQNQTNDISKDEISTTKTVQKTENCEPEMLIVQGPSTKDKTEQESDAKTKTISKSNKISKDGEVANCQSLKVDTSNKRLERKIPIGQNRISQYARTPGTRSASLSSSNSRSASGNQSASGKRENVEKSISRYSSSASISTRSGSLGSCSNSNASLSSVSSSGTIPDRSSGSGKKEVGSKVASIWKAKEKTYKSPNMPLSANKTVVSPKATQIASSYSARKSTPNRLQSPIPSTPSPHEGTSCVSTNEKMSSNEGKESSTQKTQPPNAKSRNKIAAACTRLDQSKPSSETNKTMTSTASSFHIKGQHIPKENSRGHIPPPGSKSRLPAAGQKTLPQKNENKGIRSENKPVSAIVSPFNYNPSTNISKSKNDVVPSKSMIPSPKNISSRTSTSANHTEGNEGKRVRRTCLVTMV